MLVLRRKAGEAIVLNGTIVIHVLAVEGERVKLGINAPPEVVIVRSELLGGNESGGSNGPNSSGGFGGPGGSNGYNGSGGPGGTLSGMPVTAREPRPYSYRDTNGQRPYREPEESHTTGDVSVPGRPLPASGYTSTNRYSPRRRAYDDQPESTTPAPTPNPNPRYR
jgi:carbon storage regulator